MCCCPLTSDPRHSYLVAVAVRFDSGHVQSETVELITCVGIRSQLFESEQSLLMAQIQVGELRCSLILWLLLDGVGRNSIVYSIQGHENETTRTHQHSQT